MERTSGGSTFSADFCTGLTLSETHGSSDLEKSHRAHVYIVWTSIYKYNKATEKHIATFNHLWVSLRYCATLQAWRLEQNVVSEYLGETGLRAGL